jgi:hypothetical protein
MKQRRGGVMDRKKSKSRWLNLWLGIVYVLFAVTLLANLVIIGAVPSLPRAGPALSQAISRQTWDLALYQAVGSRLNALSGLNPRGVRVLEQALGEGVEQIEGNVSGALVHFSERSYSSLHDVLQWLRWGPPISLLLALSITVFRPREVRSFGS